MGEALIVRKGGGKKSGANVWSKYSVEQTQSAITLTSVQRSPLIIQFRAENIDHTKLTANDLVGITGQFKYYNSATWNSFSIISNTQITMRYSTYDYTYDSSNGYININVAPSSASYPITWQTSSTLPCETHTLVDFVVNDNSAAYPNGAIHTDGYYYELLGQVSSANVMSLSDNAVATVQQDYRDTIETEVSNANS